MARGSVKSRSLGFVWSDPLFFVINGKIPFEQVTKTNALFLLFLFSVGCDDVNLGIYRSEVRWKLWSRSRLKHRRRFQCLCFLAILFTYIWWFWWLIFTGNIGKYTIHGVWVMEIPRKTDERPLKINISKLDVFLIEIVHFLGTCRQALDPGSHRAPNHQLTISWEKMMKQKHNVDF